MVLLHGGQCLRKGPGIDRRLSGFCLQRFYQLALPFFIGCRGGPACGGGKLGWASSTIIRICSIFSMSSSGRGRRPSSYMDTVLLCVSSKSADFVLRMAEIGAQIFYTGHICGDFFWNKILKKICVVDWVSRFSFRPQIFGMFSWRGVQSKLMKIALAGLSV